MSQVFSKKSTSYGLSGQSALWTDPLFMRFSKKSVTEGQNSLAFLSNFNFSEIIGKLFFAKAIFQFKAVWGEFQPAHVPAHVAAHVPVHVPARGPQKRAWLLSSVLDFAVLISLD